VVTAELGYIAKTYPELDDTQRGEVGEFLQEIEDHDDVQRVWAAVR
jgi:transcriptional/translational regulatory protein YebC/TACO1